MNAVKLGTILATKIIFEFDVSLFVSVWNLCYESFESFGIVRRQISIKKIVIRQSAPVLVSTRRIAFHRLKSRHWNPLIFEVIHSMPRMGR